MEKVGIVGVVAVLIGLCMFGLTTTKKNADYMPPNAISTSK